MKGSESFQKELNQTLFHYFQNLEADLITRMKFKKENRLNSYSFQKSRIEKIGIDNIRQAKLQRLEKEHKTWLIELDIPVLDKLFINQPLVGLNRKETQELIEKLKDEATSAESEYELAEFIDVLNSLLNEGAINWSVVSRLIAEGISKTIGTPKFEELYEHINKTNAVFLTTDHGNVQAKGWRGLQGREKLGTNKSGSRSERHIEYSEKWLSDEFMANNPEMGDSVVMQEQAIYFKTDLSFSNKESLVTHGGAHLLEVLIPFVEIKNDS